MNVLVHKAADLEAYMCLRFDGPDGESLILWSWSEQRNECEVTSLDYQTKLIRAPEELGFVWEDSGHRKRRLHAQYLAERGPLPPVRYIYFLERLEDRAIKIGLATKPKTRLSQHRKSFAFNVLGFMQWKNREVGFGVRQGPGGGLSHGNQGSVRIAEQCINGLFARECLDKRRRVTFSARGEFFKPSKRLRAFIATHAVPFDELPTSRLHDLICRRRLCGDDREVVWTFHLPSYLDTA